ncbi:MAG: glycosyltransferase family 2 protein [Candidatus Yanofskybacteria bacterium]|nr:glycosyltransferase family 2 protein [Candidatus Yanofskybacteria bacterium]
MAVSVSVVMPAHKEAGNLEGAVGYVTDNMNIFIQNGKVVDWEIIIVDSLEPDGSSDGTPELADKLARQNQHIRVIHNQAFVNLGFKYKQGLAMARFGYFMMVPGKNTLHGDSLKNLFGCLEHADVVIGYQADMSRRPFGRRLISKTFTVFMNLIFGLRLRYYNGTTIIPTQILRELNPDADDFAYMAEILVMLLKKYRLSYAEAPFYTRGRRKYGRTNATRIDNVISVAKTVLKLIKKVYFSGRMGRNV